MLLSDTEIALYYIIFSTGPCRRDGLVVRKCDWQSCAHGFESPCGRFKTFFNFLYPTKCCQYFSEETLPFLRCAIIGNVQVNWPKLFQDFSVEFTLIFSFMRSFNPKPLQLES